VANFAASDLNHLVRAVERELKRIRYRSNLIDGRLTETGLIIAPLVATTKSVSHVVSLASFL